MNSYAAVRVHTMSIHVVHDMVRHGMDLMRSDHVTFRLWMPIHHEIH